MITARGEGGPVGFTATSLTSVSAEPPMLSFGIGTGASSWPAISRAEHVGVHILGEHQQELAATSPAAAPTVSGRPPAGARGPRVFPSSTTSWPGWCAASSRACPCGDHRIVLAEVLLGDPAGPGRPLLYHQGTFSGLRD